MTDSVARLSVADVARMAGVQEGTIRAYLARDQMPAPDGRFVRSPWWERATIDDWLARRRVD